MRSGTETEKKHAQRIAPVRLRVQYTVPRSLSCARRSRTRGQQVLAKPHLLLVTLLLTNSAAMEVCAHDPAALCHAWLPD